MLIAGWLALLFLWTLAPLAGYDFWFYLAMGREIVTSGRIPVAQSYLGATSGLGFGNYADAAWLGNLICYAVYSAFGYLGLVMLKSALLTLSTGLVYLGNRIAGLTPFWAGAWATLALWTIRSRFEMRTYLFTTVALATLSLLLLGLEKEQSWRKRAWALAALFVLWSNLHQGILAGYLVLCSWLVFGRSPFQIRFGLTSLATLASLVRPNLASQPGFYYDHFTNAEALRGVVEWGAPSWEQRITQLGPFYLVLILLAFYAFYRLVRRLPLPPWACGMTSLAFSVAGFRSFRSIAELLPVVCPLTAPYFPRLPHRGWTRRVVVLALTVLFLTTFRLQNLQNLEQAEGMPQELARLIPKQGQVLNSFEFGNFLVFEGIPPFIHGMSMLYREQLVLDFEDLLNPSSRRQELLEQYNVTSALLHHPTSDDATLLLVEFLSSTPDWKLQAWDDTGLLFVKGDRSAGLTAVRPWAQPPWTDPEAARLELTNLVKNHPSSMAHLYLSRILLEQGQVTKATSQAVKATQLASNYSPAWAQLGACYAKEGNLAGVLLATEKAVVLAPDNPQTHLNRALALLESSRGNSGLSGRFERWRAHYHARRALGLNPNLPAARTVLESL